MSTSKEASKEENLEFEWGKKRGLGGKKKEVQFYDSFTFDGDEYSLYDSVYLYKEGEPEPYIGKLVKIWEQPQCKRRIKKIKVLWFFRPVEILNFLGDNKVCENEIFLASGDGVGLANINPLEAIAGKCSVICTSKDKRNPQPSEEELRTADFIFYRTFDVSNYTVSDKIDDKIAGVEVKFLLNRKEAKKSNKIPKLDTDRKEQGGAVVCSDSKLTPSPSSPKLSEHLVRNDKHGPSVPKEDADIKAPLIKPEPLPEEKVVSHAGIESKETASTCTSVEELVLNDKSIAGVEAEFDEDERKPNKASVSHSTNKKELKSGKDLGESDRPSKKARVGSSVKSSKEVHPSLSPPLALEKDKNVNIAPKRLRGDSDEDGVPASSKIGSASVNTKKSKIVNHSHGKDKGRPIKKLQSNEKTGKLSNGKLPKVAAQHPTEKNITTEGRILEVSRRPDTDRSKWFKGLPWEERMKTAHEQGTLVLLENLDPQYTATEIEDIIWHGFGENCTGKVVQRTAVSSPHSGQAFVIFKSRDAAEMAINKLDEGCLMLPNGRPLVASKGNPPELHGKPTSFPGHLQIDKLKHQLPREEIRRAVSTSHCSQPNTLEYDMAMEWRLLQARADWGWKELYKQHDEELRKLKAKLKSK